MSYSADQPVFESSTANGTSPSVSRSWQTTITLIAGSTFTLDLRSYQNLNYLKNIQSVFIDNSANATSVSISSGQENLVCPGNSQLRSPIACAPNTPVFTISGSGTVGITFANYQMPMAVVNVTNNGGTQAVSDVALDALIHNGAFNSAEALYGDQDQIIHGRAGKAYSGTLTVPGTTTIITGSPSCFVTDIKITADEALSITGAPSFNFVFSAEFANAGTIDTQSFYYSNGAANAPPTGATIISDGSSPVIMEHHGLNLIGQISGDNFEIVANTISGTSTISAGAFRYFVCGGSTALS